MKDKVFATAISGRTESGDAFLFIEEDGFTELGIIEVLKSNLGTEYPWVAEFNIEGLNWDSSVIDEEAIWKDISEALDKADIYG